MSLSAQKRVSPLNRLLQSGQANTLTLLNSALVRFNETSIVGATPVTQWTNIGTGGSGFDLDTVVGTAANLTTSVVNGLTSIKIGALVRLNTTVGVNISNPTTEFLVARFDATANSNFLTEGNTINRHAMFDDVNNWAMFQGITIFFGTSDTALHVWTAQFNADATSKLTVSGEGSITGNAGTQTFDFARFFGGGGLTDQTFCEYVLYDKALNATEIARIQSFLTSKWGA